MTTPKLPIDEVPEQDREEVPPERIRPGDYVYDPKWRRWLMVANIRPVTSGQITVGRWGTERVRMEWTFYYFAEADWAHGTGAREDRLVTRRTRAATNRENVRNTRGAVYQPPQSRHPNGPTRGFPRQPGE